MLGPRFVRVHGGVLVTPWSTCVQAQALSPGCVRPSASRYSSRPVRYRSRPACIPILGSHVGISGANRAGRRLVFSSAFFRGTGLPPPGSPLRGAGTAESCRTLRAGRPGSSPGQVNPSPTSSVSRSICHIFLRRDDAPSMSMIIVAACMGGEHCGQLQRRRLEYSSPFWETLKRGR